MPSKIAEGDVLEEYLLAAGRGDRAAFAQLYELSAGRLYAIVMQMFGNRATADDVLQDSFVLIWRKAAQYDPERGRASAWMAGVTRNCAIDRLRAEKTVGDFHVVSPGMPHPNAISSATGALFYVRGEYHPAAG